MDLAAVAEEAPVSPNKKADRKGGSPISLELLGLRETISATFVLHGFR
jgi:hypothetical protein